MSVSLSVVFTGLCALVSDGDGKPGEVLLLDTRKLGHVRGVALPAHAPILAVSLEDLANPESSNPSQVIVGRTGPRGGVGQIGLWDLAGAEVRIRTQGGDDTGLRFFRPGPGETSWPTPPRDVNDPGSWRDVRYVADMATLVGDGRIDPSLVGSGTVAEAGSSRSVAARIHLDSGLLEGGMPSEASYRDDLFEFRTSRGTHRQALTDTVQWTLETDATAIAIDILPSGGGPSKRLLLAPSVAARQIHISNLPVEDESHPDGHGALSDPEMAALHFGAYYKLLLNEPDEEPLPESRRVVGDQRGSAGHRPTFCGLAMFSRP